MCFHEFLNVLSTEFFGQILTLFYLLLLFFLV